MNDFNANDFYEFFRQFIFAIVAVGGGITGVILGLERGYNEWLSFLLPFAISVPVGMAVCHLLDVIASRFLGWRINNP